MRLIRTDMLRLVQRAFAQKTAAEADLFRPDRRDFLKKAAIGTAAFSASPFDFMKKAGSTQPKIAVLGAGLAGLAAAFHLKKAGLEATVFEGSGRIGGRAMTLRGWAATGVWTDVGGEFIDENHADLLGLAREMNLDLVDLRKAAGASARQSIVEFGGRRVTDAEIVAAFQPFRAAFLADLAKLPKDLSYRSATVLAEFDALSISEYLTKKGISGWFFDFLVKAFEREYGMAAAEQSAMNLLLVLRPPEKTAAEAHFIGGAGSEVFKISGGSQALADRLAESIAPSKIVLNERLIQIETVAEGTALWFDTGRKEVFDYVVVTLPFPKMREIGLKFEMSDRKKAAIRDLALGNSAKLIMAFYKKIWHETAHSGESITDQKFASGWDASAGQDSEAGAWTAFLGGPESDELKKEKRLKNVATCLETLEKWWPGATKQHFGKSIQFPWIENKWSLGGYACYRKGQWQAFAGVEGEPEGAVFFAGEHCDVEFQGFMNGAVLTGRRAAEAIAAKIADRK